MFFYFIFISVIISDSKRRKAAEAYPGGNNKPQCCLSLKPVCDIQQKKTANAESEENLKG